VLGVADVEQLFKAVDAIAASDPAQALRAAGELAASGRDPGQVLRDLEVHARELLTVQILGEVPGEISVTDERDRRLFEQARALSDTDAVRLLDLLAAALEATANGAQARIQLELVLVKAAAPEMDASVSALQSRVQRLEAALNGAGTPPGSPASPTAPEAGGPVPSTPIPATTPVTIPPVQGPPTAAGGPSPSPRETTRAPVTPDPDPERPQTSGPRNAGQSGESGDPSSLTLDAATAAWPAVVDLVRAENAMLAASLAAARPLAVGERELTLAFPSGAAFLKRKAEQDDHRRVAAEALQSVVGRRLALRYELKDEEAPTATEAGQVLSGEELVRRFLEEFDAEEIDAHEIAAREIEHASSDEGALR
jgi:DNA polymerase-3 subunit gamma/tau